MFKPTGTRLSIFQKIYVTIFGVKPNKIVSKSTPSDTSLNYENISFTTSDNIKISGWFIKSNKSKGVIIVAHGYDSNKGNLLNYSIFLNKNGFNTLLIDFRGFGESEGTLSDDYRMSNYLSDIESVYDYIKKLNFIVGLRRDGLCSQRLSCEKRPPAGYPPPPGRRPSAATSRRTPAERGPAPWPRRPAPAPAPPAG